MICRYVGFEVYQWQVRIDLKTSNGGFGKSRQIHARYFWHLETVVASLEQEDPQAVQQGRNKNFISMLSWWSREERIMSIHGTDFRGRKPAHVIVIWNFPILLHIRVDLHSFAFWLFENEVRRATEHHASCSALFVWFGRFFDTKGYAVSKLSFKFLEDLISRTPILVVNSVLRSFGCKKHMLPPWQISVQRNDTRRSVEDELEM